MTSDVFTHPWRGGLFGDARIAELLSADASLASMLRVEAAYARALGSAGAIDEESAEAAASGIAASEIAPSELAAGTARDGVPVPALVGRLKARLPEKLHPAIHSGLTSQDVVDTALVLTLVPVLAELQSRLTAMIEALQALEQRFGACRLMGRTRMQAALPIAASVRIAAWRDPLVRHLTRLEELAPRVLVLQLGGAAGARVALGDKGPAIAAAMAAPLDLRESAGSWHTARDGIAELAGWLSLVTGTLGKMGQDVALMAQQGIDEIALSSGGTSSAMPHKQNPIKAELLVTLARFNAVQLSGLHLALNHEQERSGAAWALEWMLLPQMIMATARALATGRDLCLSVQRLGQ